MLLGRFLANKDGGAAPFLALSLIPLMGFTGAAIDYSRANATKAAMQAALDSTGLILSKKANGLSGPELGSQASAIFNAQFNRPEAQNVTVTHVFSAPQQGSYSIKLTAQATVRTHFTALIGTSELAVSATSEILWGIKKLNLALALDNTGSMSSSGKMTALKQAAHNLLNTLQQAAKQPDDIKISIVPFATDVNVGTANKNASWIDWEQWENVNGSCSKSQYTTKTACVNAGRIWTTNSKNTWNGCVWDRDQNYDTTNTATSIGTKATLYSAHQASNCPTAMMTLTNSWSALNSKIDDMNPTGNTNVTIGLQMAFQMLSSVAPFNASAPKNDLDKVIVLLTDGDNTQNRWSTSQTSIDNRTKLACTNAKAANVKLYTVRVINGNASLLQQCATKTDMYYNVQNSSQLSSVFATIAQNLANLRLAK